MTSNGWFLPIARSLHGQKVQSHRKWIYDVAAAKVILNPDPEDIEAETWEEALRHLTALAKQESLREHVRSLLTYLRQS